MTEERGSRDTKWWFESGYWLEFTPAEREEEAGREDSTAHYLSSLSRE